MKLLRPILPTIAASLVLGLNAQADPFRESQIVGYSSGNLGSSPATGTLDGWENSTANVTVTAGSGSLDGTSLGLVASDGDKANVSPTFGLNVRNLFAAGGTFPQTTETNIYFSFLYRFNVGADVSTTGQTMVRVNRANSGTGTAQHWDLVAKNVGGGVVNLGIAKAAGVTNYATSNIIAGQTFFVVVRQHIIPGTQNDIYDLWINPPPGSFFTNEVDVPPSSASVGALPTDGSEDQSGTGPGRCVFGSGADANFDEFRVGGTWADVTPYFGQCIPASVTVNPLSQTNSAEIAYAFSVTKRGTSATYQWQLSTDGGTSWNNIPGANARVYTTPNLQLPADNGNKYRVVINVPCDGSSATSAVATVTLITPQTTPTGVVMDDFFDDMLRDNLPITETNSVWRTATSANLIANLNPPPGYMQGIPLSGSSSLWLGYFTPTNPVHLDIGRAMKITLPFTADGFTAHTNNSSLRVGVFDYADGGTRISADGSAAGGSRGNGLNVRGYMLNLDFGPTFSVDTPVQLLVRNNLNDDNLMGSISDYLSLGSGPVGGGFTGAPAFQAAVPYTLEFTVTRTATNSVDVTAAITGGGTNWSFSTTESTLAYHRFDAFGIRANSLETTADSFTFPEFKVEVIPVALPPQNIQITSISRTGNNVTLQWNATPAGTYTYSVQRRDNLLDGGWTTLQTGISTTSYTDSTASGSSGFYRVSSP